MFSNGLQIKINASVGLLEIYIRSASDPNYALKAINGSNGGNICIVPFTLNDSALLFKFSN